MNRFFRAARSANRVSELFRCANQVEEYTTVIGAFLGITRIDYPHVFRDKTGQKLTVYDFEDVTTLWAVWCADEYRIPKDAKSVIDAGANIGAFSLFALASAPLAQVIALEPFPTTFKKLSHTIEANGIGSKVFPQQAALTHQKMPLFMDASPDIKSHSRKAMASAAGSSVQVDGLGLDDIIDKFSLSEIDYLKVDIEGGEVPFFNGVNPSTLRKVRKIGIECHSQDGKRMVWGKLESSGFKLARVSRGSRMSAANTAEFLRT